jgi:hypothetical protein
MQELFNIWRLLNSQLWAVEWDRVKPQSFLCYGIPCFPRLRRYVLLQATHALTPPSLGSHPDNSSVRQALQGYEARLGDGPCASLQASLSYNFFRSFLLLTEHSGQILRIVARYLIITLNVSSLGALPRPEPPIHHTFNHGQSRTEVEGTYQASC